MSACAPCTYSLEHFLKSDPHDRPHDCHDRPHWFPIDSLNNHKGAYYARAPKTGNRVVYSVEIEMKSLYHGTCCRQKYFRQVYMGNVSQMEYVHYYKL